MPAKSMNAPLAAPLTALSTPAAGAATCFHCGEPIAAGVDRQVELDGRLVALCCPGCAAATSAIRDFGPGAYYRHRDSFAPRPHPDELPCDLHQVSTDADTPARLATVDGSAAVP